MSVTGADSDLDHSLVPELEQATRELEVDIDMMLTHAHQLLNHDNQRLATWRYLLDQNSKSSCITGWRAGPARPTHPGAPCVSLITIAFTLATILELCFMLTLCYYSQNYSRIIIASPRTTVLENGTWALDGLQPALANTVRGRRFHRGVPSTL